MNILQKLLAKFRKAKVELQPHEKAAIGQGNWGRQNAKTEPIASISARVIRKDGTIENLGIISKPKEE